MSSIATCPACAAEFALPEFASGEDRAQCPGCQAEFPLADAPQRELPVAALLPPLEENVPQAEPTAELELPEPSSPQERSPALCSAETVVAFPSSTLSALAGWEERLKRAIDGTATEETTEKQETAEKQPSADDSAPVTLENAPEFEFHMDPPVESPVQSFSATSAVLPNSQDWFEGRDRISADEPPNTEPPPATAPVATKRTRRSRKPSLVKRAGVAAVFGLVGIVLGQYALLWLRGPSADYMQLAQLLPDSVQPATAAPVAPPNFVRRDSDTNHEPREPSEPSPLESLTRQLAEAEPQQEEPAPPADPPPLTRDDAVAPATIEVPRPRLLPATNATLAEFVDLTAVARDAAPTLLTGDLKSEQSARAKGHAYMAFARLAERFDFVNDLDLDADAQHAASLAQALFRTTAATAARQSDFAIVITRWWQHLDRPHQGIFLVGRVQDCESVGDHTVYHVAVVHKQASTLIPVLLDSLDADEQSHQVGDEIGVVGTIVTQPRKVIPGFNLDMPQLAVAQDSFAVPAD